MKKKSACFLITSAIFLLPWSAFAQQTVSELTRGLSPNNGMYNNVIPSFIHSQAFTEICFKSGEVFDDQNPAGESTSGGNCLPDDVGWIIEEDERPAETWEMAKAECLKFGMRLPEPFEFLFSCTNARGFGLVNMTGNWEWGSNMAIPSLRDRDNRIGVAVSGNGGCNFSGLGTVGETSEGGQSVFNFRCAK